MAITLTILAISVVFFINGRIRSDIVALCSLLALILCGILTPAEALSGFSNSIVIMMAGLFIVGGGIFRTGLAKKISGRIITAAGGSEWKLFVLVMLVTSFIGAFVSNTGTVALMLPIVVSMAATSNINSSRILMPMAFASSIGGMMTLIGTPPNLVAASTLDDAGFDGLSFFSFTPVGIVCLVVGMGVLWVLSKKFLGHGHSDRQDKKHGRKTTSELAKEYRIYGNLFRLKVEKHSPLSGRTLMEADVRGRHGVSILEIRRRSQSSNRFFKTIGQLSANASTVIAHDDILYVYAPFDKVSAFAGSEGLEFLDSHTAEESSSAQNNIDDIGIAEVVLMPGSSYDNQDVKKAGFREKYGLNILGIRRKGGFILSGLENEKIHFGDTLLVQGTWDDIARLQDDQNELIVVGQPLAEAAKVTIDYKAPVAAGIMLMMVAVMVFDIMQPVTAVLCASVLMVLSGCLRNMEEAYKTINWESIVLIAAMLPMSLAVEKTGGTQMISSALAEYLGGGSPMVLLAVIYFSTSILTLVISNTATAVLFAPIALQTALQAGVSPYPFLLAVSVAASMCFATPFSTPPNALVMSAGKYTFADYLKVGLPLQVIMGIVMVFVLPLLFPF